MIFQNVNNTFEIQFRTLGSIDNNTESAASDAYNYPFSITGNFSEIDLSRVVVAQKFFSKDYYANVQGRTSP